MRVVRVFPNLAMTWPRALLVRQKDPSQPASQFPRDFLERRHVSGPRWALDLERFAIKQVIPFERLDDQEIDREPNWASPIRVSAEKITVSLARNVIDSVFLAGHAEDVRLVLMNA